MYELPDREMGDQKPPDFFWGHLAMFQCQEYNMASDIRRQLQQDLGEKQLCLS
jgi:hypothetical protein